MKLRGHVKHFFFPPPESPRWKMILPFALLGVLTIITLIGGAYIWAYTNSPKFCGTACHTMPPEYASYQVSPHARIDCVECHIGREFIGHQMWRKAGDVKHVIALAFKTYEYPLVAKHLRPAREICERCHSPDKFSDDSLRVITHFGNDKENTPTDTYLVLKTGGGSKREGMGRGIHWHIENKVQYYPTDRAEQDIPYVRVVGDDGSIEEFVDVEADLDTSTVDEGKLREMDCITCHNRITHIIYMPEESIDSALAHGTISTDIPDIRRKGVEVLRREYATKEKGLDGIAELKGYYQTSYPAFYAANEGKIDEAIAIIQKIYDESVFPDQKVDWDSHPNNIGHVNSPGCFRCHDGKHMNAKQEAVRLECNLCHSIPIEAGPYDFLTNIEISRGPEPESHLNPNWISLHHSVFDDSCSGCHTTDEPGGTANTSFCSNSACHGKAYPYTGFDAPKLREILQTQIENQ